MSDYKLSFDYDFIEPTAKATRSGYDIFLDFKLVPSKHLMIRGSGFYAMYDWETGLWTTEMGRAVYILDRLAYEFYEQFIEKHQDTNCNLLLLKTVSSGRIDKWHLFCRKQMWDNWEPLNQKIIFQNTEVKPEDHASFKLPYAIGEGSIDNYQKLFYPLFAPEQMQKLEWATGAIISGFSKECQKMFVLFGGGGSGKSTWLELQTDSLFDGYDGVVKVKDLVRGNSSFPLETMKNAPLITIDDDAKLDRIEDNTLLNSIVSHGAIPMNTKFQSIYEIKFHTMLCIGTNSPVQITDAKSGLLRRVIDIRPTGCKHPYKEYMKLKNAMQYELGAIAYHCLKVFEKLGPDYYENYVPVSMMAATNDFYDFIDSEYGWFREQDSVTLTEAWKRYQQYVVDAAVKYPFSRRIVNNQLQDYFLKYQKEARIDGRHVRNLYSGFKYWEFGYEPREVEKGGDDGDERPVEDEDEEDEETWLKFNQDSSVLDILLADCPAQYASRNDRPIKAWADVETVLRELDTSKVHYVKVPVNHIVIDFDLKDESGQKSFLLNWKAASQWPRTYAELSKGGEGIHLHYLYSGDATQLERLYDKDIEIKVFTGGASLRRRLSKCNDIPVAAYTGVLPLKEVKKTVDWNGIKNERMLRRMIIKNLLKEYHANTKPSVDYIYDLLQEAYDSGMKYDVSDLESKVIHFAGSSTNQSAYCLKKCTEMHFKSDEPSDNHEDSDGDDRLIFFDVEVFINLFVIVWKIAGVDVFHRMINPASSEVEKLFKYKLVGFNNRKYDNHILWAASMGYTPEQLYRLSQKIITEKTGFFGEAYNVSYTDIYDFASAGNKKSLKKFEIELGIHHQELGLPWDQPVDESLWDKVAEYCENDVRATEAVFNHLSGDWKARQILATLSGLTVNDTTNQHSTKIIFENDPNPQAQFNYPDLSKEFPGYEFKYDEKKKRYVSLYRGREVGEGGRVFATHGVWNNVPVLDIASMHPSTIEALNLFGDKYTKRFVDIKNARVLIKHGDFDKARKILDGKLAPFLDDESIAGDLSNALKTVINSVYGLTSASFPNKFKDPRNIDNVVAKRGALFMVNLEDEVTGRGYTVAHVKTDSIKIPDATPEIIKFVIDYGKAYGYSFEHESTYERMCLVNNAVYIAKYATPEKCQEMYGYVPAKNDKAFKKGKIWDATGAQFAQPYVFKTLFSHEPLIFADYTETKSVTSALYLDMNEDLEDGTPYERELDKLKKKWLKQYTLGGVIDIHDTFETTKDPDWAYDRDRLKELISKCHNYQFVGRVGCFVPVLHGGGLLMRQNGDGYAFATGTSGHRWIEAELYNQSGIYDVGNIDISYHEKLVSEAKEAIGKYVDVEWFLSDDVSPGPLPDFMNIPYIEGMSIEEIPFK